MVGVEIGRVRNVQSASKFDEMPGERLALGTMAAACS